MTPTNNCPRSDQNLPYLRNNSWSLINCNYLNCACITDEANVLLEDHHNGLT